MMEFPIAKAFEKGYQFHYFNYGFRSARDLRMVVNILVKKSDTLEPLCFNELIINDNENPAEKARSFQKEFIKDPEKYTNISLREKKNL